MKLENKFIIGPLSFSPLGGDGNSVFSEILLGSYNLAGVSFI